MGDDDEKRTPRAKPEERHGPPTEPREESSFADLREELAENAQTIGDPRRETKKSKLDLTRSHPAFQDKTPEGKLMNEFRIAFDGFKADMHSGLDDLRGEVRADTQSLGRKIQANADKAMEEHEVTRRHVSRLTSMVRKLWEQVHGSDPPPPTGSDSDLSFAFSESTTDPHRRSVKAIDSEIAVVSEIKSNGAKIEAKVATRIDELGTRFQTQIGEVLEAQKGQQVQIDTLLTLQKEQMGKKDPGDERRFFRRLGDGILWILRERDGHKFLFQLIAAITGLVTMIGYLASVYYGRPFLPSFSQPTPIPVLHDAPLPSSSGDPSFDP